MKARHKSQTSTDVRHWLYVLFGSLLIIGVLTIGFRIGENLTAHEFRSTGLDITRTAIANGQQTTFYQVGQTATTIPYKTELAKLSVTQTVIADVRSTNDAEIKLLITPTPK